MSGCLGWTGLVVGWVPLAFDVIPPALSWAISAERVWIASAIFAICMDMASMDGEDVWD